MNTVHRGFGRLRRRTTNDAHVSVLLKDYDDADRMLARIIEASKAWRDGWASILTTQLQLVTEFQGIYNPIIGAGDSYNGPEHEPTPDYTMERTAKLKDTYDELRTDLLEEVNMIDARIIKPAMEAKEYIQPLRKVMKKREDKKLDFERFTRNVDSGRKKLRRSDRENAALAKAEKDLARATEEYNSADQHLRETLPPLLTAAFSILPNLLAAQILTQNTLLAQYYTALHEYCQDEHFPSEPPSMDQVISTWDSAFKPTQYELETGINMVANGKAVKQPMKLEEQNHTGTMTGMNIRNGINQRRSSSQPSIQRAPPSPNMQALPAPPSPNTGSKPRISPSASTSVSPSPSALLSPESQLSVRSEEATPTTGTGGAHSPAAPRTDYFARDRIPSASSASSSVVAAKKKPPPPPPPKRGASNMGLFVTALYNFEGQSAGDLAFREGDRIRVVKKTESTDDWWEGELRGAKGAFPANYCQAG